MSDALDGDLAKAANCKTVKDFYAPRAREVIGRICRPFLDHLIVTPTELLHHREYQKRFELAGNALETAVQKAALA